MPPKIPQSHTEFKEWLYLEPDGELGSDDRRRLNAHLVECRGCRQEQRSLTRLRALLSEAVVPVDEQFSARIMKNLPEAGWEARNSAGWRLAVAVFVLLGTSAALLGLGGEGLAAELPLIGAALALLDLFRSALLAGGGLLAASWTGIGLALDQLLGGSRVAFAAFGVLVLGIDVLFVRMLLRQRARRAEILAGSDGHPNE